MKSVTHCLLFGVYVSKSINCWVRNVEVTNAENPVIFARRFHLHAR